MLGEVKVISRTNLHVITQILEEILVLLSIFVHKMHFGCINLTDKISFLFSLQ